MFIVQLPFREREGQRIPSSQRKPRRFIERPRDNGRSTGGITGRGFRPGRSGNPGGRPQSLAKQQGLWSAKTGWRSLSSGGTSPTTKPAATAIDWKPPDY
jgi:hypothetical protein